MQISCECSVKTQNKLYVKKLNRKAKLELPEWNERNEIKVDYMYLMPFCSVMGNFNEKGLQHIPSPASRSKQD